MPDYVTKEPIAIVGVGCVLPDAPDVPTFWANVLAGKSSIREVPVTRWNPALFWSADKSAPDKTYAKIGAFVADNAFNPLDFRMPPGVVVQIDPSQQWALAATRQALKDANYKTGLKGDEGREFDRSRCAVILGNAMGGELMKLHTKRLYWPQVEAALRSDPSFANMPQAEQEVTLRRAETMFKSDTPPITEDSMPGTLSNVAAGRVANVFDLGGKNFTTDAACASSLAALDSAVDCLRKRECDMIVWGGTDRSMDITPYVEFSKIGALSADGSRPFDAEANGFVMGEGCALFILRRLSDAERDGDRIYALVRGVGGSSDGKGKGITAPNPVGQVKAVMRAYQDAEMDPTSLGYIEAHGTSTPVGDPVELTSAEEAFRALRPNLHLAPGSIAVGSVKSNMGHLKSAAGAVGLLKAALALKDGVIPPSINVRTLNPRIEWATSPFKVQTTKVDWPRPAGHPRRAAVSSFGFGGTNFHVVLEEYVPGALLLRSASQTQPTAPVQTTSVDLAGFSTRMQRGAALEAEALVLDATTAPQAAMQLASTRIGYASDGTGPRLRDVLHPLTTAGLLGSARVGIAVTSTDDVVKKLEQAQKAATNPAQARLAFNQGVFINKGTPQGKVAFLFPGQGTQYVNMFRDLAQKYEVVRATFEEADRLLVAELDGVKLTDILWPTPDTPEAQAASEKKLQLTEFTQPAVLAADVAILRLLRQWGVKPDVVAGHSLGEYGALVAAGVLSFGDALHAVAARGREMAHVEVPDLGKMASVSGDWHAVQSALAGLTEYVIPANKNCPSQTVIAGSSKGVDEAIALLQQKGMQAQPLPVSAAFHSAIVAPASQPLRKVLGRLDVKSPQVRVLSNVGAQPYQDDVEWIRDNLATQVASPVEWIDIVERMYAEGVRTFIEVGPKLALTNFVRDILGNAGRAGGPVPDAVAIGSNHPKKGGVTHANELFAFLGAWGFNPRLAPLADGTVYTPEFLDPVAPFRRMTTVSAAPSGGSVEDRLQQVASVLEQLRSEVRSGPSPRPAVAATPSLAAPASADVIDAEVRRRMAAFGFSLDDVGISGLSVGLPGAHKELFADDNWDRILRGENMIDALPAAERAKLADKNIVRLVKGDGGSAQFQVISDVAQVIQLAGQRGGFDVAKYGVGKDLAESLDRTFQYAIAAGLEALRDAGIPLQRTYLQTSQGGFLPKEWKLPESLRDETGIIFASAFPGFDNLIRDISRFLADKYSGKTRDELQALYNDLIGSAEDPQTRGHLQDAFDREFQRLQDVLPASGTSRYEFNRKFLFNVLSMGHSQLAQFIGARGPNTQVNAACASTTQAVAIAEDWIRTGRCRRVLVVGADDVTSDAMFEWIGAGFLAAGAATTKADVAEAALPFDKRRHGMIVGMGAVGMVVEAVPECTRRGMRPIARLLATRVSNSAYHGSRLDVDHIASEMTAMLASANARYGIVPGRIAAQTVFMSHETYTPARGGSASAEIHALRAAFGTEANKVIIANTKGFTGHPQGASIEDAIVLKGLQRGRLPPIANFRDPDPELGDLNLSHGGRYDAKYALRLAAGFGSQVAMSLCELVAKEAEQMADPPRYAAWLGEVTGLTGAKTEVVNRTLRIVDQGPPTKKAKLESKMPAPLPPPPSQPKQPMQPTAPVSVASVASVAAPSANEEQVLAKLIAIVGEKTGYPRELLDPNLDMEADLGIDTVKQAELFGAIRDAYALPQEQNIQIKDYPTLRKVAGYVTSRLGGGHAEHHAQPPHATTAAAAAVALASPSPEAISSQGLPIAPSHSLDSGDVLPKLLQLVADKTGYPKELLDPNLDMEADLGIDTVKQAELFGAIRDAYALPQEQNIQIKDYPTLAKVAGYVQSRLGTTPVAGSSQTVVPVSMPASAPPMRAEPVPAASVASSDDVLAKIVQIMAAKTGYPADMLAPDLDMEADLGIDTVKQAELFGEVRTTFGIAPVDGIQLKDYPTIRKVAGFVLSHTSAASGAPLPAATTATTAPGERAVAKSRIVRRVPMIRPQKLPDQSNTLQRGPVLLLGDIDDHVRSALSEVGFEPVHTLKDGQTPVGIVAVANRPGPSALERIGPLFNAAKTWRANLGTGSFVCTITRQDGSHGLQHARDASMAALSGLCKALRKELPQATVKAIDLHVETPDGAAKAMAELLSGGPRTEICYGRDGQRFVVEVAPQEIPEGDVDVEQKGIVVSGGAQGITVELLAALAPQAPKLLLLGRTEMPSEAESWSKLDAAGWKAVEQAAMADLKARGERVTPVAIQKAMAPKQKAAEVFRNLNRLTGLGATVLYAPIDVGDAKAVSDAIAWGRSQFGAIHGVIHAAGVEISKDLASKDRAQFDAVFSVKAKGWDNLMAATRDDKLEFLVAFGSVAGRFGNIGQTDYSAANEYLAKAVKTEAAKRKCMTATTIAWGPWGEVGMATKGSILQIMEQSGVTPIPTADGVAHFLRELGHPGVRESVVAGEVGAIDADKQVVAQGWDLGLAIANQVLADKRERFRLLESIEAIVPDQSLLATVVVDAARDPALADHRVDGIPYMPGVFGLEAFAEAASLLAAKDASFLGADEVRFSSPLKQLKPQPVKAQLSAKVVSRAGAQETRVHCRLTTQFVGPDGRPHGEPRLHFEATIRFGTLATIPKAPAPSCDQAMKRADIYPPFFHGPSFQVLGAAGPLSPQAVGMFRAPTEAHFGAGPAAFSAMPMLTEALFQVCGLSSLVRDGVMSLPAGIARVDCTHVGPLPPDVRLRGNATGKDSQGNRTFDAEAVAADGRLLLRLTGYAMVETGPAPKAIAQPPAAPAPPPASARPVPVAPSGNGTNGARAKPAEPAIALPEVDDVQFAAVTVTSGPADDAHFTAGERAKHASFPVDKRRDEWRAGRLAAKQAFIASHPGCSPLDVEVHGDESGRPKFVLKGQESALWLSISHRAGLAIAAVSPAPVGVDLETVEERPRSFLEEAFAVAELKALLASDDPKVEATAMWTAKEAALKRAGVGLKSDLRQHVVTADGQGGAVVEGPAFASQGGRFGVRFFMVDGKVCAVSAPVLDPPPLKAKAGRR
ncbi:MAG: SDR family NAD(P)-dependent oxidoreductase [bacterium]